MPALVKNGIPSIIAWPIVASAALALFIIAAIVFINSEAKMLNISFSDRLCIKGVSLKMWLLSIGLVLCIILLSGPLCKFTAYLLKVLNYSIPTYMPFFLNPAINPSTTPISELTPGFNLSGKYWIVGLFLFTTFLNVLAEDIYFRAWMLPKMSKMGHYSWIINGILFATYHTFQIWLFPIIIIPTTIMAFLTFKSKSILPSFVSHFILNVAFTGIGLIYLISK